MIISHSITVLVSLYSPIYPEKLKSLHIERNWECKGKLIMHKYYIMDFPLKISPIRLKLTLILL